MAQSKQNVCCGPVNQFKIESIVRFDERGQFVLPKDIREKADIEAGDKLAVISCEDEEDNICCLTIMKSEQLQGMVKDFMGPLFEEMVGEQND